MATRGGKTRRGRRNRWNGAAGSATVNRHVAKRQQTPEGLLAGDSGQVVLVTSTLSRLSFRHPHTYGRYEVISPPPVPSSFR